MSDETEGKQQYETRIMRPASIRSSSSTAGKWKYANAETGKIEFHDTEQPKDDKLRLIRGPGK